jgi:hypothetical protein
LQIQQNCVIKKHLLNFTKHFNFVFTMSTSLTSPQKTVTDSSPDSPDRPHPTPAPTHPPEPKNPRTPTDESHETGLRSEVLSREVPVDSLRQQISNYAVAPRII